MRQPRAIQIPRCALYCILPCALLAACSRLVTPVAPARSAVSIVPASGAVAVVATWQNGAPIEEAAVSLQPLAAGPAPDSGRLLPVANLDVVEQQFQPHVLVVQTGTRVVIHNLDGVTHQIYSFSTHPPLSLTLHNHESASIEMPQYPTRIVIGCRIYNRMIGYIDVTDSSRYATTDAYGYARFGSVTPGEYRMKLWFPEMQGNDTGLESTVKITPGAEKLVRFVLR